jgi:hypothetical protein
MAARRRKTLVLGRRCTWTSTLAAPSQRLVSKDIGEPDDAKASRPVRRGADGKGPHVRVQPLAGLGNLASRLPYIIWGFRHVTGFRRRHVGASIQDAWTTSLDGVRATLDADTANDHTLLLRATTQELGPTRDAVLNAVVQRLEVSHKQAAVYTRECLALVADRSRTGIKVAAVLTPIVCVAARQLGSPSTTAVNSSAGRWTRGRTWCTHRPAMVSFSASRNLNSIA